MNQNRASILENNWLICYNCFIGLSASAMLYDDWSKSDINNLKPMSSKTSRTFVSGKYIFVKWKWKLFLSFTQPYAVSACEHRAQIFKKIGVKFYYSFIWIKWLGWNLGFFAINLPWQFIDILISFKLVAFIKFEAMTSSNF